MTTRSTITHRMVVMVIFICLLQLAFFHIKNKKIPGDKISKIGNSIIPTQNKNGDNITATIINHISLYQGFFVVFIKGKNKRILLVLINSIKSPYKAIPINAPKTPTIPGSRSRFRT